MKRLLLAAAFLLTPHHGDTAAYSPDYAAARDNKISMSNIRGLSGPAYELSILRRDYTPTYVLFPDSRGCINDMQRRKPEALLAECHKVTPGIPVGKFWSVLVYTDPSIKTLYSETRFSSYQTCVDATGLVYPVDKIGYTAICVNTASRASPEPGGE